MKKILVTMTPEQKEQSIKAIAELLLPKNKSNLKEGKLFAACFSMSNLLSVEEVNNVGRVLSADAFSLLVGSQWLGKYPKETSARFIADKILDAILKQDFLKLFYTCDIHADKDFDLLNKIKFHVAENYHMTEVEFLDDDDDEEGEQ